MVVVLQDPGTGTGAVDGTFVGRSKSLMQIQNVLCCAFRSGPGISKIATEIK